MRAAKSDGAIMVVPCRRAASRNRKRAQQGAKPHEGKRPNAVIGTRRRNSIS